MPTTSRAPACIVDANVDLDCLNLAVRQLSRRLARRYDARLSALGLKSSQYALLSLVRAHRPVGLGAQAEHAAMDGSTLTRCLRPLRQRGWVVQVVGEGDGRERQVHLSDEGRVLQRQAQALWRLAQADVLQLLGPGYGDALRAVMSDCNARLRATPVVSKRLPRRWRTPPSHA